MARRSMSQTQIAERLGISQPAVSARLLGRTPFDINELVEIAKVLDVPVSTLIGEKASA